MELTAALILQNFFGRFPNIKVCLSELGTVWLPYTLRKMDHAFLMGRKATWGTLDRAAQLEIFRRHFVVAPYPEENVAAGGRRGRASSPSCSARTSPTARAWPTRSEYVDAQLKSFSPRGPARASCATTSSVTSPSSDRADSLR